MIIGGAVLLIAVAGITYAFIEDYIDSEKSKQVTIESDTVDEFTFVTNGSLSLHATNETLPQNGSNLIATATSTAKLKANSTTNSATKSYYLYAVISNNTFVEAQSGYPEVLLKVYDSSNTEITSLTGLTYNNTYGGFDITGVNGTFTVASNQSISSSSSQTFTEQTWTFQTIYLNHNFDQTINYGKALNVNITMTVEPIVGS